MTNSTVTAPIAAPVTALPSKIVCVGRNYAEHAKELGNDVPESPVLFIKPPSSLVDLNTGIDWNRNLGECHYECELSIQIGQRLKNVTVAQAKAGISGLTLGLDLTLRDLQNPLKNKGQPWERAKAFDGACVLAEWVSPAQFSDLTQVKFELLVNGQTRQHGNTAHMLFDVIALLVDISQSFTLEVGDVVMTGTPAGVAALQSGDKLDMVLHADTQDYRWITQVL